MFLWRSAMPYNIPTSSTYQIKNNFSNWNNSQAVTKELFHTTSVKSGGG